MPHPASRLDRNLSKLLDLARSLPSMTLGAQLLAEPMRSEAARQSLRALPTTTGLAPAVRAHDPIAVAAFDRAVDEAVRAMRGADVSGPARVLSALDRVSLLRTPEYCDDPMCSPKDREDLMACIDWLNEGLGSYDAWMELLEDDLVRGGGEPVRVLELAAGHGSFSLAMKERYGDDVDVVATDVYEDYLRMGCRAGLDRGLDVAFLPQDATNLTNLAADSFDVVVCTQSLHHFEPGVIARVLAEAARVASRAVWLIDGERSLLGAALLGAIATAHTPSWPVLHDTFVSLRKMYTQEELELIARLAPGFPAESTVEAGRRGPGFAYVRLVKPWADFNGVEAPPVTMRSDLLAAAE